MNRKMFIGGLLSMMVVSTLSFGQNNENQCKGITKSNTQCKNITRKSNKLCHNHDVNHVKESEKKTVICSGTTKQNKPCKNRTKDLSGKCHNHRD